MPYVTHSMQMSPTLHR